MPGRWMSQRLAPLCAGLLLVACADSGQTPLQPEEILTAGADVNAAATPAAPTTELLVSGLQALFGSTVGPGRALFVTEPAAGRILRVDPETGAVTTFASGLPIGAIGVGGVHDVAFIGRTAYALVSFVTPEAFGGSDVDGLYRVDGPNSFTLIADIGAFNRANPPATDFFVSTGVSVALEIYQGGFLVSDGHLNRVLRVTREGEISIFMEFDNIVPTGLALRGRTVYMAQAGPVPHLPEDGKVVAFGPHATSATEIASGAPLLVDVEFGRGHTLFALAQGIWDGEFEGSPALPNTGALVRANRQGGFTVVVEELDRPISLEFIGTTAYVATRAGEIWKIGNVAGPPFGKSH